MKRRLAPLIIMAAWAWVALAALAYVHQFAGLAPTVLALLR